MRVSPDAILFLACDFSALVLSEPKTGLATSICQDIKDGWLALFTPLADGIERTRDPSRRRSPYIDTFSRHQNDIKYVPSQSR